MPKKSQRPTRPTPMCVYCGVQPGTTRDHVIPKCLFTVIPERDTITVRVCRECNEAKARDEAYFADAIQGHHLAYMHHPVARHLADTRVRRSARQHSSDFARELVEVYGVLRDSWMFDHIPDDAEFQMAVDGGRLARVLEYIVRGLHAHYLHAPIPTDCVIEVKRLGDNEITEKLPRLLALMMHGPYVIGDGVATIAYGVDSAETANGLWILMFYGAVVFPILTRSASYTPPT